MSPLSFSRLDRHYCCVITRSSIITAVAELAIVAGSINGNNDDMNSCYRQSEPWFPRPCVPVSVCHASLRGRYALDSGLSPEAASHVWVHTYGRSLLQQFPRMLLLFKLPHLSFSARPLPIAAATECSVQPSGTTLQDMCEWSMHGDRERKASDGISNERAELGQPEEEKLIERRKRLYGRAKAGLGRTREGIGREGREEKRGWSLPYETSNLQSGRANPVPRSPQRHLSPGFPLRESPFSVRIILLSAVCKPQAIRIGIKPKARASTQASERRLGKFCGEVGLAPLLPKSISSLPFLPVQHPAVWYQKGGRGTALPRARKKQNSDTQREGGREGEEQVLSGRRQNYEPRLFSHSPIIKPAPSVPCANDFLPFSFPFPPDLCGRC